MNEQAAQVKTLEVKNLQVATEGKEILKGVNLEVRQGEVHALMGPNGSGKSTLSNVIMGHPDYEVTGGSILYGGEDITGCSPDERARMGVFMAFQYPVAIPGVTVAKFLKRSVDAVNADESAPSASTFLKELRAAMKFLEMNPDFINRYLNEGFSGGEKKRMEILQMMMLKPSMTIMDETDSGLDIDALKIVSKGVNELRGPQMGLLLITHYERILSYIQPDHVHIFYEGKIVQSGGVDLVKKLEAHGYDWVKEELGEV